MKFGLPTLVECSDLEECARVAKHHGLDFIEVNMSFPQYQVHSLRVDELKALKEEFGIFFTIHADELLNPFDFNPGVSQCYFNIMREYICFAKELDIPIINMHLLKGVYVTQPERVIFLNDVYREEYLSRVSEFIKLCEDAVGESGVLICIENVDSNKFTDSQNAALGLFMQSPVFALTLDVGHDCCLGNQDKHVFDRYSEKLMHMHLHDSDGRSAHLPLGTGVVNVREKLALLKAEATCLVEVKTLRGLDESIDYLRENNLF